MTKEQIEMIARAAYEAIRAYCEATGELRERWDRASEETRASYRAGVDFQVMAAQVGMPVSPASQHEAWLQTKQQDGWTYGPVLDTSKKLHPAMVPFGELPPAQRAKDFIFCAVVSAFLNEWFFGPMMAELHRRAEAASGVLGGALMVDTTDDGAANSMARPSDGPAEPPE